MAKYDPVIVPLYGVPIRDALNSGDKELMQAMRKVSAHMLSNTDASGGAMDDWKAAHAELEKALG